MDTFQQKIANYRLETLQNLLDTEAEDLFVNIIIF